MTIAAADHRFEPRRESERLRGASDVRPLTSASAFSDVVVPRHELVQRLEAAADKKFVLLVAPPGYGKSVLLAQWSTASAHRSVVGLVVEPTDDDATILAGHLCDALTAADGRSRRSMVDVVELGGRELGDAFVSALIADAATLPPTTVVLDDFHCLANPALVADLARIIELTPQHVRFIVSTRIDPALPYHRWRLDDQFAQLRQDDLQFSASDAAELVARIAEQELDQDQLELLLARTEGWGAGLQLAALSMRGVPDVGAFIGAFAGDDRNVSEYLIEQVLRHQAPAVRDFLLETSVLDRLNASLCDAVTGRRDGQQMLDWLSSASLFMTRLDSAGEWFRCHQLFRDLLRSHLRHSYTGAEAMLLRRAAAWNLEHDEIETAGDYLVAAGDEDRILRVVREHGGELNRAGRIATVARWLDAVVPEDHETTEVLLLDAMASMLAGETGRAETRLDELARRPRVPAAERLIGDLVRTWAVHDQPSSRRVVAAAERVVRGIDVVEPAELPNIFGLTSPDGIRKAALVNWATAAAFDGETSACRSFLARAAEISHTTSALEIDGAGAESLADAWSGSLRSAEQHAGRALAVAEQSGQPMHPGTAEALLAVANVARQRNELDDAGAYLERAWVVLQRSNPSVLLAVHAVESAELALAGGDADASLAILAEQRSSTSTPAPKRVAESLRASEARALIALGELDRAERILDLVPSSGHEVYGAGVRLAVELGDLAHARELVEHWPRDGEFGPRIHRELWQCILDDIGHEGSELTRHRLEGVVNSAGEQGHVRVFLDTGQHALRLLRRLYHAGPTPYLRRLVGVPLSLVQVNTRPVDQLVEQLTTRERAVLGLLPSPLDNAEIAERLGVSVNTLKTHLKHIYQKLDVNSRRGAVAAAEDLYLL